MSDIIPQTLTLSSGLCSPQKTAEFQGSIVPWEVGSYQEDALVAHATGGLFDLSDFVWIRIEGEDAQDFLQRMTTVQFKDLSEDRVVHGAFLNGKAGVIALGVFLKISNGAYSFLVSRKLKARVLEHLEQFHFSEKLVVVDETQHWVTMGLWSEDGQLASRMGILSQCPSLELQTGMMALENRRVVFKAWRDVRRPALYWIQIPSLEAVPWIKKTVSTGCQFLGRHLFEWLRIQSGIPWGGEELSEHRILLEGNFLEAVARNKGCYPGQEVIERIFTYGQVNQKLYPVRLSAKPAFEKPLPLSFFSKASESEAEKEKKEAGELVSYEPCPTEENAFLGLMLVKKAFWPKEAEGVDCTEANSGSHSVMVSTQGWQATVLG